jgi:hypothetical protein
MDFIYLEEIEQRNLLQLLLSGVRRELKERDDGDNVNM